jgi:heptosyltransferase-2
MFLPKQINPSEKILVIGPSWLGDMVMAQSLFKSLYQVNPAITIDVAAPNWSLPLLERMPEVANGIELDLQHGEWSFEKRYYLGRELQKNNYTSAIVLPNSWKSALIPWFAKIPKRIGWIGEMRFGLLNDIRYLKKSIYKTMVERYIALAYQANYPLPNEQPTPKLTVNQENIDQLKLKFAINTNNNLPVLALCLGAAFGEAKCWPEEYYLELASMQVKKQWQVWLFGTKPDLQITDPSSQILNFSGKTKLLDTIDLLSLADVVVCNDSGLMHIAASFNKKIIAIYGATSSKFTPPLAEHVQIINKHLPCSPCFARTCPLGHHKCMKQITVEEISNCIQNMYK